MFTCQWEWECHAVQLYGNNLCMSFGNNCQITSISWPLFINHKIIPIQGTQNIMGDNADEDADAIEVPVAVEMEETLITGMIIKIEVPDAVKDNGTFNTIEGEGKITHIEVNEDNGMEMTLITLTETTGIEIPMVKVILTGVEDGIIIIEVKDIVTRAEGEDGIPISNITIQGINCKVICVKYAYNHIQVRPAYNK